MRARTYCVSSMYDRAPLTLDLYYMLPKELTISRSCTRCGSTYIECENIGRHMCCVHPGVRMLYQGNAGQNGKAFYSCCGAEESPYNRGCLQCDHSTFRLSESCALKRASQIQDSATIVVPHVLMRFLTHPLQSALLYDTGTRSSDRTHKVTFPVIELAVERYRKISVTHAKKIVAWSIDSDDDDDDDETTQISKDYEFGIRIFNLDKESRLIWEDRKNSPLFSTLLGGTQTTKDIIDKQCENSWKNVLSLSDNTASNNAYDHDELGTDECPDIRFVIVSRIGAHLQI